MKHKPRTKEWLVEARRLAGISQIELAELIGLKGTVTVSQYETGVRNPSDRAWLRIEEAVRPLAPLAFVDTDALIAKVEVIAQWEPEGSSCQIAYAGGRHGLVITGVGPVREEMPEGNFATIGLSDALNLLMEQKAGLEKTPARVACSERENSAGAHLKRLREDLGLGQRKVASLLSVSQPSVSALENGRMENSALLVRYRQLLEKLAAEA